MAFKAYLLMVMIVSVSAKKEVDSNQANIMVDRVIKFLNDEVRDISTRGIHLPAFPSMPSNYLSSFKETGWSSDWYFSCGDGLWIEQLGAFKRISDAELTFLNDKSVILQIPLGFGPVKILHVNCGGKILGKAINDFDLIASAYVSFNVPVEIEETKFGDFRWVIQGPPQGPCRVEANRYVPFEYQNLTLQIPDTVTPMRDVIHGRFANLHDGRLSGWIQELLRRALKSSTRNFCKLIQ